MDSTFTWTAHPAREHPRKAAAGVVLIVAIAAAAGLSFGPWWAALAAIVLGLSINRFFLPSRFTVDSESITARYPMRTVALRWSALRRFVVDANGGYLSTRSNRSWFDAYSGMHLIFGAKHDEAIAQIRSRLAASRNSVLNPQPSALELSGDRAWAG